MTPLLRKKTASLQSSGNSITKVGLTPKPISHLHYGRSSPSLLCHPQGTQERSSDEIHCLRHQLHLAKHLVKLLNPLTALFTSVLFDEVVDIAVGRTERAKQDPKWYNRMKLTPEEMGELLTFCMNTTYFKFQGEFYQQVFGAAMWSHISLIIANMFMEMFENVQKSHPHRSLSTVLLAPPGGPQTQCGKDTLQPSGDPHHRWGQKKESKRRR